MTYKDRCIAAIQRTSELNLTLEKNPLPFSRSIRTKTNNILVESARALQLAGYNSSSDLAKKCIPVHLILNMHLKDTLNVDSYITIGDRYWSEKDIYCEMSYLEIERELNSPNPQLALDAHVWLTLSDGSILDCTSEAHLDIIQSRGIHRSDQCMTFIKANEKENTESGYYRPFLFGADFLVKTAAAPVELVNRAITG